MRVLVLANEDEGLYQFRGELLRELLKSHEVFVSVPKGNYVNDLAAMGCSVIDTAFERHGMNPFCDLRLFFGYLRCLKRVKPDIVLTYTIKPNVYGGFACGLRRVPFLANITGLGTAVENPGFLQKITVTLYRLGLKRASVVFFQNAANRDFMIRHKIVKENYRMIPGSGVNLEHFCLQPFPEGDTVEFAFISRIMKQKGIDQYLEAAELIRQKYPNTVFHVCGYFDDPAYEEILKSYVRKGVVVYHGNLRDVREIHKVIQCTVHPTYYPEGLSNVLLESAASGRALITTGRSGCREVVDHGVNGLIVNEQDSRDLAEKIEQFLGMSREERCAMGLAGRAKVEREFSRKIVVEAYLRAIADYAEE